MSYNRTNWVNGGTYGADSFNNIESGIVELESKINEGMGGYIKKQTVNMGKALRKLRMMQESETTEFCFMGDSVFYAFDYPNEDGKAIAEDCVPDNGSPLSGFKRRPITIYDTFNDCMNRTFENKIRIKKKIYTGDTMWTAYYRWNPSMSDFIIINLGINDAIGQHVTDSYHPQIPPSYRGNTELYATACRKMIERELDNGTAVVFMTPTKLTIFRDGFDNDKRTLIDIYEQVGRDVAKEYGVPVIDGNELVKNFATNLYIDAIHYTDEGFKAIGSRLVSYFIGGSPCSPLIVHSGSYLGVNPQVDNVNTVLPTILENTSYSPNFPMTLSSEDLYVPINRDIGGVQASITGSGKVVWSFYTAHDDMIVIPSCYSNTTDNLGCRLKLDFGVKQGSYNNYWNSVGTGTIDRNLEVSTTVLIENTSFVPIGAGKCYGLHMINSASQPVLRIISKGWHTIEMTPIYPPKTQTLSIDEEIKIHSIIPEEFGNGMLAGFGLNFLSLQDYKKIITN